MFSNYTIMHNPLPKEVRLAIAEITQNINHTTVWCQYSQATFPGECHWSVTGGNDWNLDNEEVSVVATVDGLKVTGHGALEAELQRITTELEVEPANANLQNQQQAVEEVLAVLETALKLQAE